MRFTFLDRSFAIPKNYQPSLYSDGFLIQALLPDFTPYSKARRDEWFAAGTGNPSAAIFVNSLGQTKRPEELIRDRLRYATDPNGQPRPAGLRRYDMQDRPLAYYKIVYVPEQPGDVILIGCSEFNGKITGCEMDVIYDYAGNLEVVFNSHFLADWRRIADDAHRLLRSFESH